MKQSILYRNVFKRDDTTEISHLKLIKTPHVIYEELGLSDYKKEIERIQSITDKDERNHEKRNYLPAVDVSPENILTIDIDGINDKPDVKKVIIEKVKMLKSCYACMESVSGNLVLYFRYKCDDKNYKYLFYKIYLEMTLLAGVDIDFLPEKNRLRYVSLGELYHFNEKAEVLTDILKVDNLPHTNRGFIVEDKKGKKKRRFRKIYKS